MSDVLSATEASLPAEGRLRAVRLARGVSRLFETMAYCSIVEFTLPNGRRADVASLGQKGEFIFTEIKTSLADFRSDLKWETYLDYCDRLYFAVPEDFPAAVLPIHAGLIIADDYGGAIIREAPVQPLSAARRKSLVLRFAHHAAARLARVGD